MEEFAKLGFTRVELEGIRKEHLDGIIRRRDVLASRARELGL